MGNGTSEIRLRELQRLRDEIALLVAEMSAQYERWRGGDYGHFCYTLAYRVHVATRQPMWTKSEAGEQGSGSGKEVGDGTAAANRESSGPASGSDDKPHSVGGGEGSETRRRAR